MEDFFMPTYGEISRGEQPIKVKIDYTDSLSEEGDVDNNTPNDYTKWMVLPNNTYVPTNNIITKSNLPSGKYQIGYDSQQQRYSFIKKNINLDELLKLPVPAFNSILSDMEFFWKNPNKFKEYKYTHKRGILLHGEAGCGKTSLCSLLSDMIVNEMNGVVFSIDDSTDLDLYIGSMSTVFRTIEPNTPVLTLMEDLDGLVIDPRSESRLLNLLDGVNQLNNVVYIGCTNYPENLKGRILNRPSRFDKRYYVGLPDENVRRYYLENKINKKDLDNFDLDKLVNDTYGLTIAHLGELIKGIFIFGKDRDEVIKELKDMNEFISSTKYSSNKPKIGLGR